MTKTSSRTTGVAGSSKILITTASLAAMFGGWVGFTLQQARSVDPKELDANERAENLLLELPPIPTLIPEPSQATAGNLPTISAPVVTPVVIVSQPRGGGQASQSSRNGRSGRQPVTSTSSSR